MKNTYTDWKYAEEDAGELVKRKVPFVVVTLHDQIMDGYDEPVTQFVIVSQETMEEEEWRAGWPIVILLVQWIKNRMTRRD